VYGHAFRWFGLDYLALGVHMGTRRLSQVDFWMLLRLLIVSIGRGNFRVAEESNNGITCTNLAECMLML